MRAPGASPSDSSVPGRTDAPIPAAAPKAQPAGWLAGGTQGLQGLVPWPGAEQGAAGGAGAAAVTHHASPVARGCTGAELLEPGWHCASVV